MSVSKVAVPEEFQVIGFSGLFHTETTLEGGPEVIAEWAAKVPCLLRGDKWMLLSVDHEAGTGVVVRRDDCAVAEAFTKRT